MRTERLERLNEAMQAQGMAGLALMPAANLEYLTGLHFHAGKRMTLALFPAGGDSPCLLLPSIEAGHAQAQADAALPLRFYPWSDAEGPSGALEQALHDAFGARPAGPVGVEFTALRLLELRAMEAILPDLQTVDATGLMAGLRMRKDAVELAAMTEAARIIDRALYNTIAQIKPGMTERELSVICSREIIAAGGQGEAFPNIVASGPNSANPHHNNTDRAFAAGDLIIIDCGAIYEGYVSDITRTVALGEPGPEQRRIYELVLAANYAGRAAVHPGISGEQIDQAARTVIEAGGYGEQFMHRTGHGIGLEGHELPYLVTGSDVALEVGTTFTVEPGIYVNGLGGVRIEDDMVITEQGGQSLTHFERDLMIIQV
jgi:Xaa-Pro aminopeptidase